MMHGEERVDGPAPASPSTEAPHPQLNTALTAPRAAATDKRLRREATSGIKQAAEYGGEEHEGQKHDHGDEQGKFVAQDP